MRKFLGLLVFSVLASCTSEKPYKQVEGKDEVLAKSASFSENEEYIYLPSVGDSSRTNAASRPQWIGDAKLVKLRMTETALLVEETEADPRFQDTKVNNKPVLRIPVEHIDYKCSTDSFGDCQNVEVLDRDTQIFYLIQH